MKGLTRIARSTRPRSPRGAGWVAAAAGLALAGAAHAYPGGTPGFQTDAAPYCASCHASRSEDVLALAGDRAGKELAESKHLAVILQGEGGYASLSPAERAQLVEHVKALDAASTVELKAPESVKPGEVFKVTVNVTGGAGPVVGVGLVDAAHRWLARPAPSAGWTVLEPPAITGQDFKEQTEWLHKRPEELGRNLSFVNVAGIASDASKSEWGRASVSFTLRAPATAGTVPLAAAYWYGTEKGSPLGTIQDPIRGRLTRGGLAAASGRVIFTPVLQVQVQ